MLKQADLTKKAIVLITFILTLQVANAFVTCDPSHYDFVGLGALGKQNEFNCAFIYLNDYKARLDNVTFNATQGTQYVIYDASPTFYYLGNKQKAYIIGDETILVDGGRVEVYLTFKWAKNGGDFKMGTGETSGVTNTFALFKNIIIKDDYYGYQFLDVQEVQWTLPNPFPLERYEPKDITEEDKAVLTRMLNSIMGIKTVRNLLEEKIQQLLPYFLKHCLYDENHHLAPQFDYTWVPSTGKPPITISMYRKTYQIEVSSKVINSIYEIAPEDSNSSNWICGNRSVPYIPLNPVQNMVYQEFTKITKNCVIGLLLEYDSLCNRQRLLRY